MFDEPSSGSNSKQYLPHLKCFGNLNDPRLLLRRHRAETAAVIHRLDDDLVREDVELLLHFALHVLVFGRAEDVGEARAAHLVGDHLRGEREVVQHAGELTRRLGVIALLLDDEPLDRDDRRCGMFDHAAVLYGMGSVRFAQPRRCVSTRIDLEAIPNIAARTDSHRYRSGKVALASN